MAEADGEAAARQGPVGSRERPLLERTLRWVPVAAVVGTLVLALAARVGGGLRSAVLLDLDVAPPSRALQLSDASPLADRFFALRDSVTAPVPWTMTRARFLSLYHLENNRSARAALSTQLGASAPDDVLPEGGSVTFLLTAGEVVP